MLEPDSWDEGESILYFVQRPISTKNIKSCTTHLVGELSNSREISSGFVKIIDSK